MLFLKLTHYNDNNEISEFYVKNQDTGLGNMLFQISSAIAYCKKYNSELYIVGLKTYLRLEELGKEITIFRNIENKPHNMNVSIHMEYFDNKQPIYNFPYIDNMSITSYLENYNNFHHERELIISLFSLDEHEKNYFCKKYNFSLNESNIASLHVRCGSIYRRNYNITTENILTNTLTQLYYKGFDKMLEMKPHIKNIIVCTDDMEYSMKILHIEKYKHIRFIYSNERDYMDVWLMSLLKNNIISFSTLSWWGAYLNINQDKCIVCCKEFREDLHMPDWIIV